MSIFVILITYKSLKGTENRLYGDCLCLDGDLALGMADVQSRLGHTLASQASQQPIPKPMEHHGD